VVTGEEIVNENLPFWLKAGKEIKSRKVKKTKNRFFIFMCLFKGCYLLFIGYWLYFDKHSVGGMLTLIV